MDSRRLLTLSQTPRGRGDVYAANPRVAGAIAEWRFDEGSGQAVTDYAGVANLQVGSTAGVDTEDPSWVTAGLRFQSGDYCQNISSPSISQPVTHIVCGKFTAPAQDSFFISDGGTSSAAVRQIASTENGVGRDHQVYMWSGTNRYSANNAWVEGQWHIMTIEYNGATSKFYVGDSLKISASNGAQNLTGLTLCARYSGTVTQPDATIGYYMLYDKILSSEERAQNIAAITAIMSSRGVTVP